MTRDEGVALIKQQLGFRSDLDTTIVGNLQLAQSQLELAPTKPWFLLTENATKRVTIGERRLALPDDFLEEYEEGALEYVPDDVEDKPRQLDKDDKDTLDSYYMLADAGDPESYALVGNYFYIYPLPDDDYLIRMLYYARDVTLSSNVENKFLKWIPYLLLGEAGYLTAAAVRDSMAMGEFSRWKTEGRLLLENQNEARKHANRSYQIGGPEA